MKNAATTSAAVSPTASEGAPETAKPRAQVNASAPRVRARPKPGPDPGLVVPEPPASRKRVKAKPSPAPTVETVLEGLVLEATLFDKSASQANRIKAWELIGKHLGMFKDRKDESEPVSVHFDIKL